MRGTILCCGYAICAGLAAIGTARAQRTTLVATALSAGSHRPIANAEVVIVDEGLLALTDTAGVSRIRDVPAGRHRVRVRRIGFVAVDIELAVEGDSTSSTFFLTPAAQSVDTVHVVAPSVRPMLRDFEQRRAMGIGRFLTADDLAKDGNREFGFVAVAKFPGLRVQADAEGHDHIMNTRGACGGPSASQLAPSRLDGSSSNHSKPSYGGSSGPTMSGSCTAGAACPVVVYLDGMKLGHDMSDMDLVRTWDLEGVEYYTGASPPVQYRVSGSACGVMLLWSR